MILGSVVLLGAALAGGYFMTSLQAYKGETVLRYGEDCITQEQVETFWEEKAEKKAETTLDGITLYSSRGSRTVENESFGRRTSSVVLEVFGNMNSVFPDRLREGSLVSRYDTFGCVISEALAEEIFSSHNVTGQTIRCGEQEYVIRGLIKTDENVMMVPGKKDAEYSHIWISHKGESASAAIQELGTMLPDKAEAKSEGDLYVGAAHIFAVLPVLLLFFTGMGWLRSFYKRKIRREWIKGLCSVIWDFAMVLGIYGILSRGLYVTDDYLPPSWADFSFWGDLWREKSEDVKTLIQNGAEYRDRQMFGFLAGSGICSLLGGVCVLYVARAVRRMCGGNRLQETQPG